jgi:hypothetical protein|tara:strand:- start:4687 stop:5523 length:837 start_codon:yes stop_codon:yes gene_type:complete
MRANDLKKITQNTKIYLDMDGVLADFFSEYSKVAGVKNYKDIPPANVDPVLNKLVGTDFFAKLKKFATADTLVALAIKYTGSYSICSSPLRNDYANSAKWKKVWLKKNLNPQPASVEITPNKGTFAVNADGSPNILIDDRGVNIVAWRSRGGIGIKYQADEDSLDKVATELAKIFVARYPVEEPIKEGIKSKAALGALMAVLSSSPAYGDSNNAQDTNAMQKALIILRSIENMKDYSREGAEAEAQQEFNNIMRAIQGMPDQSKVYPVIKDIIKQDTI